ncbi:MAG: AI-2E family transporter [Sphingobacteriales bacterium]
MEKVTRFNNRIRQVVLLIIIIMLAFLIIKELYIFVPGFLGAVTMYILTRDLFFKLTSEKKNNPNLIAGVFILMAIIAIGTPAFFTIKVIMPKVHEVFSHSEELIHGLNTLSDKIREYTGSDMLSEENLAKAQTYIGNFIPTFLNSSFTILGNLAMMFFMVFFMYTNGQGMENALKKLIPFQENNVRQLAFETNNMVRANALGIPLISLIQGITALIGYWIFGLSDFGLWGFLTGVFAFFPVVGTMIIYVPLVVYLYAQGSDWQATGLLLYNVLITGNVEYLARVTLMRKIGDVHPLVTILGVIVGLGLFGFMGFIFGPLLLSYLLLLIRIYSNEFIEVHHHQDQHSNGPVES